MTIKKKITSIRENAEQPPMVRLGEVVDDLYDEHEVISNYTEYEDDLFPVHTMTPEQAMQVVTHRRDTTVIDAFSQFASRDQKAWVSTLVANWDESAIIVLHDNACIDGNHRLVAAITAKRPIKYIDLGDAPA